MPARLLPCFSSRAMLAREEAVSAVSLPAKNADSSRQTNTITSESQSCRDHYLGELVGKEGAHLGRADVVFDEGLADAAHQDEGELAALHFLVLRDQIHQCVDARARRRAPA